MENYIYLVELDIADTPAPNFTDNQFNITYNSKTYFAGKLEPLKTSIKQTGEVSDSSVNLKFSAIDGTIISLFTNNQYKNRSCKIIKANLDDLNNITSTEVALDGLMNNYTFVNTPKNSILTLSVSPLYISLKKSNSVDLGVLFSDYINDNQTLYWGKDTPIKPTPTEPDNDYFDDEQ